MKELSDTYSDRAPHEAWFLPHEAWFLYLHTYSVGVPHEAWFLYIYTRTVLGLHMKPGIYLHTYSVGAPHESWFLSETEIL